MCAETLREREGPPDATESPASRKIAKYRQLALMIRQVDPAPTEQPRGMRAVLTHQGLPRAAYAGNHLPQPRQVLAVGRRHGLDVQSVADLLVNRNPPEQLRTQLVVRKDHLIRTTDLLLVTQQVTP
jgi:hypothetical protein